MILYPAIDLKDGQCVRLVKGEMADATVFSDDPAAQARSFADAGFAAVLAFGVYHNLPAGVAEALAECRRVLTPGGVLFASVRAANLHNRGIDWLAARRVGHHGRAWQAFQALPGSRDRVGVRLRFFGGGYRRELAGLPQCRRSLPGVGKGSGASTRL